MTKKEIIEDVFACFIWLSSFILLFWVAAIIDAGAL
jgi:hypothetical protein